MNLDLRPSRPTPKTPAEYLRQRAANARSAAAGHRSEAESLHEEAEVHLTQAAELDGDAAEAEKAADLLEAAAATPPVVVNVGSVIDAEALAARIKRALGVRGQA